MGSSLCNNRLSGIVPPLVTPLTDEGEIDPAALARLIEHVLEGGVRGLFVLGTTGEGPSLGYKVRASLVESACLVTAGRAPVFVGVTDTSLAEVFEMSYVAGDAGADAVVFAPPCYFPIDQLELEAAARRLAAESPLPVMLYNMPALTRTVFEPETVRRLLDEPKIIGLKDSSGDLDYFRSMRAIANQRPDWTLMVGPERLLAETVSLGGNGGVCGGANVFPKLFVALYDAAARNETATIARLQALVDRLDGLYRLGANPALSVIQGVKAALAERGICAPALCFPFAPLCNGEAATVQRLVVDIDEAIQVAATPAVAPPQSR